MIELQFKQIWYLRKSEIIFYLWGHTSLCEKVCDFRKLGFILSSDKIRLYIIIYLRKRDFFKEFEPS